MKKVLILASLVILVSAAFTTTAQSIDEPAVKVLPAAEEGKMKVLYTYNSQKAVEVKFIDENGLISSDKIKAGSFQRGFMKKYDISRIKAKSFWVEVSSADITVRYKMIESGDRKSFVPHLEKTTYNHPMVATTN